MSNRAPDPLGAAVAFLRAPGRAERVLATHHRAADGTCAGCPKTRPVWPCFVGKLARQARGVAA